MKTNRKDIVLSEHKLFLICFYLNIMGTETTFSLCLFQYDVMQKMEKWRSSRTELLFSDLAFVLFIYINYSCSFSGLS
jgi:hypothetical protein